MWDRICIRAQRPLDYENPLDLGALAESIILYGNVRLVLRRNAFDQLVRACSPEGLIRIAETPSIEVLYLQNDSGVFTEESGTAAERHLPTLYEMPHAQLQEHARMRFAELIGRQGRGRRLALRLERSVEPTSLPDSLPETAATQIRDPAFVDRSVAAILDTLAPGYSGPRRFSINDAPEGRLAIATNIDFEAANDALQAAFPGTHRSLDRAAVVASMMETAEGMFWASEVEADMSSTPLAAALAEDYTRELLTRGSNAAGAIAAFQAHTIDGAVSIRDVVNSGRRSLIDVLDLLERADKFRGWLRGQDRDTDAIGAYIDSLVEPAWGERLPTRALRWTIMTGLQTATGMLIAGPIGAAAAVGLGAADTFVLQRLLHGWRPSHFVNGALADFVSPD